jgi:glycosyltransferase involved in cell wall biosynthesis
MPELIKSGETGYLVESEDEMAAMSRRIEGLDRSRCRAWVAERFSIDQMVSGYERLYRAAARGEDAPQGKSKQRHAR